MANDKKRLKLHETTAQVFARWPYLLVGIIIIALSVFPELYTALDYNRTDIKNGHFWRIFTGHLLHTNHHHLWLNFAALLLLALLHGKFYSPVSLTLFYLYSSAVVSVGIFVFTPNMHSYVGLSGVLHGLFILGALWDIKHKDKTGYLLLVGILLKVGHEQMYGATESLKQLIDADVAIDAHLYGTYAGASFFLFQILYRKFLAKQAKTI